jgi:hypothetical protein
MNHALRVREQIADAAAQASLNADADFVARRAQWERECEEVKTAAALLKELDWDKWAAMIGKAYGDQSPASHIPAINAAIAEALDPYFADYADLLFTQDCARN